MAEINRVPRGFLGVLDAKTGGRSPAQMSPVLGPSIDMTPWYLADIPLQRAVGSDSAPNIVSPSLFCSVLIPPTELWAVYGIAISVDQATSANWCFPSVGFRPSAFTGTTVYHPVAQTDTKDVGATGSTAVATASWFSSTPIYLGPGTQFVARGEVSAGTGGATADLSVIFRAIQV